MAAQSEVITIESTDGSGPAVRIDRSTTYQITRDLNSPFEASFELGDGGTFESLRDALAIGRRFTVALDGKPLLTGRMLTRGSPVSSSSGATVTLTVRSILADAQFSSCAPFALRKPTLRDVVLKAYESLGVPESAFIFNSDVARDLFTGRSKSSAPPTDLSKLTEEDARVRPPETVHEFVDRHLRRFSLMHWDSPDGRIVVGSPDDSQSSTYRFQLIRSGRGNNLLGATRTEDYESIPAGLAVYGQGGGRDFRRARVSGVVTDPLLLSLQRATPRQVILVDESITTQAMADARARREMAMRCLQRDSWELSLPGFTARENGVSTGIPFAPDTVADVQVDTVGPTSARYFCWRVVNTGSASEGHTSQLSVVQEGVWRI